MENLSEQPLTKKEHKELKMRATSVHAASREGQREEREVRIGIFERGGSRGG